MPVTALIAAEAVAGHRKAAGRMRHERDYYRGVRRDLDPDVIPVYVQLYRRIRCPDHLDTLPLSQANNMISDNHAVLNSNLDPCWRSCRILGLLRGGET